MKNVFKAAAVAIPLAFGAGQANANILELSLLIDASSSIGSGDYNLQVDAYESIFNDDFYTNVVQGSIFDSVVVGVFQFATSVSAVTQQTISSDADAQALGGAIGAFTRTGLGGLTNTAGALDAANSWFGSNGVDGSAFVVDISTDGVPTTGGDALASANTIRAGGGIVNAIGVGGVDSTFLTSLVGANGFFVTADTFDEFEDVLFDKLDREINNQGVPAPGVLGMLGAGLVGLFATRRRRKA